MITCLRAYGSRDCLRSFEKHFKGDSFIWRDYNEDMSNYKLRKKQIIDRSPYSFFSLHPIPSDVKVLRCTVPISIQSGSEIAHGEQSGSGWCVKHIGCGGDFDQNTLRYNIRYIDHAKGSDISLSTHDFLGVEDWKDSKSLFFTFETDLLAPLLLFERISMMYPAIEFTLKSSDLRSTVDIVRFSNGEVTNLRFINGRDGSVRYLINKLFDYTATIPPLLTKTAVENDESLYVTVALRKKIKRTFITEDVLE